MKSERRKPAAKPDESHSINVGAGDVHGQIHNIRRQHTQHSKAAKKQQAGGQNLAQIEAATKNLAQINEAVTALSEDQQYMQL